MRRILEPRVRLSIDGARVLQERSRPPGIVQSRTDAGSGGPSGDVWGTSGDRHFCVGFPSDDARCVGHDGHDGSHNCTSERFRRSGGSRMRPIGIDKLADQTGCAPRLCRFLCRFL